MRETIAELAATRQKVRRGSNQYNRLSKYNLELQSIFVPSDPGIYSMSSSQPEPSSRRVKPPAQASVERRAVSKLLEGGRNEHRV